MQKSFLKKFGLFLLATSLAPLFYSGDALALPVDVHGIFAVDSALLNNYRKLDKKTQNVTNQGSQEINLASGDHSSASIQTYILHLNPAIIVNDSATFKSEFTTGYGRGGLVGENTAQSKSNTLGNALYHYNTNDSQNSIVINQLYAELYADMATYIVGRHTAHWGLGALISSGENIWDRHFFSRDGVTANIKIANVAISPFFARSGAEGSQTKATRVKEMGISALYDNSEKEMSFGLLYNKKTAGAFNSSIQADITADNTSNAISLGKSDIKVIDIFFKKSFNKFSFSAEIPLMNGEIGHLYNSNQQAKYKGKAIITESNYTLNNSWKLKLHAGSVSGHGGSQSSFDAMYLNPNYQIANILFRYNLAAISDNNQSLFDSYITNSKYLRLGATYVTDKWTWDSGIIYAKAAEVAKAGSYSFNHNKNKIFMATTSQSNDLGLEVDSNLDFHWSKEVIIGGAFGYHFVGDYFAYTNDASVVNDVKNSFLLSLRASLEF